METPQDLAIRQREAQVVGRAPRLEPLTTPEAIDTAIRNTRAARAALGSPTPVTASDVPEFMTTMLRHPELYDRVSAVSVQLLGRSVLTLRDRQLAVLRVSWLCQAPYIWGEHVKQSKRIGLSSDEIERVTQGSSAAGWTEHESAILRAVEELHEGAAISDATWATLARQLDDRQLIELPVLVGQFTTVMYLQNALKMRLAAGNIGLRAR